MQTITSKLIRVLALSLVFSVAGCAGTPSQRSTGQYIDDATITSEIKAALIDSPYVDALDVDIETYRGKVQLNGFVNSESGRMQAEQIAIGVDGVKEVTNNLEVQKVSSTVGQYVDDTVITSRVKSALLADSLTGAYEINVETNKGVVQLSGWVDSERIKDKAETIASSANGVTAVHNEIGIRQ